MQLNELITFKVQSERLGLQLPPEVDRAMEINDVVQAHYAPPRGGLLALNDDEVRARVTELAIREHQESQADTRGMVPGGMQFIAELLDEVQALIVPSLEGMVDELRPRFEEGAAPVVAAVRGYGFTLSTRAEDVIDMADEGASAAFRSLRPAIPAIQAIVSWRVTVSRLFDLSPTVDELVSYLSMKGKSPTVGMLVDRLDYSVCFAEGDNWSADGAYYVEHDTKGSIDWLALAAGGLRLNSPAEVASKINARHQARLSA